jgi:hypothetical protein
MPVAVVALFVAAMTLAAVARAEPTREGTMRVWAIVAVAAALTTALAHFIGADTAVWPLFQRRMIDDPIARLLGLVAVALGAAAFVRADTSDRARVVTAFATIAALVAIAARDLLIAWVGLELAALAAAHASPARPLSARVDRSITLMGAFGVSLTMFAAATTQLDALGAAVTSAFTQWGAAQPYVELVELAEQGGAVPAGLFQQARAKAITGLTPVALLLSGLSLLLVAALARAGIWPLAGMSARAGDDAGFSARALVQLAAWAMLLRVFVSELATARLVSAPYGWTQALPAIAVLAAVFVPLRSHDTASVIEAARRARAGTLLLLVTAAATMLGSGRLHARVESGTWATAVAEWTVSTSIVLLAVGMASELAIVLALAPRRRSAADTVASGDDPALPPGPGIVGLAHAQPARATLLALALLALAGVGPTLGGVAWWMMSLALADHSSLTWIVPMVLLGQLAALRHIYVALAALASEGLPRGVGHAAPAPVDVALARGSDALQVSLVAALLLPLIAPGEALRRAQLVGTGFQVNSTRESGRVARERRVAEVDAAREGRISAAPYGGAHTDGLGGAFDRGGGTSGEGRGQEGSPREDAGRIVAPVDAGARGDGSEQPPEAPEGPTGLGFEDERRGMSVEGRPPE